MAPLDILWRFFPSGTTEGEQSILQDVFIYPDQMSEVMTFPSGNPCLLVGSKGVGKTAILQQIVSSFTKQNIPVLLLLPDDLPVSFAGTTGDIASLKRLLYEELKKAIAIGLGTSIKSGLINLNDAKLVAIAQDKGERSRDLVQNILIILSSIAKNTIKFDAKQLAEDLSLSSNNVNLIKIISKYLDSSSSPFWLLIDDTDQIAPPNEAGHLNRIWGFLLAVRRLATESKHIKCIVSLRTEIWLRLQREDKGQRDQIDHIRPLVVELRAREDHLTQILDKRLLLAAREYGSFERDPSECFFEDTQVTLPGTKEVRPWSTFILKNSRERPRDIVQLVGKLARTAQKNGHSLIKSSDATDAMHPYSKERAEYLAIEVGSYCEQFLDVVRSFADIKFECTFETLRHHLKTVPSRFAVKIGTKSIKPDDDDSVLMLLALLHESGFLNPRVKDITKFKQYKHISFYDDPFLVCRSRWNELQSAAWEVHPAFRTYLIDVNDEMGKRRPRQGGKNR